MALTKILLSLLWVATAARGNSYDTDYPASPARYRFAWAVQDEPSFNDYAQEEERDGDVTRGSYRVALPDGRTQVVNYYVDKDSGFVAGVTYLGEVSGPVKAYQATPHRSTAYDDVHQNKNKAVIRLGKSSRPADYIDVDPHQDSTTPNKPQQLEIPHIDWPAYEPDNNHPTTPWPNQWYHSRIQSGEGYHQQETVPRVTEEPQDPSGRQPNPPNRRNLEEIKQEIAEPEVPRSPAKTAEDKLVPDFYSGVLWREEYMRRMNERRLAAKQRESARSSQADDSIDEPKEQPKLKPTEVKSQQSKAVILSSGDSVQPKPGTQRKPFLSDYVAPI